MGRTSHGGFSSHSSSGSWSSHSSSRSSSSHSGGDGTSRTQHGSGPHPFRPHWWYRDSTELELKIMSVVMTVAAVVLYVWLFSRAAVKVQAFLAADDFVKLDSSLCEYVDQSELLFDGAGWITEEHGEETVMEAMENFYDATGIQAALVVASDERDIPGITGRGTTEENCYDYLFDDEGHLLVLAYDDGWDYYISVTAGDDAEQVITEQFLGEMEADLENLWEKDMGETEMFEEFFEDSAELVTSGISGGKAGVLKSLAVYAAVLILAPIIAIALFIRNKRNGF